MNDVLLIIPAYNEAGSIDIVMKRVLSLPQYDYLIIDDGSTDGTSDLIIKNGWNHLTHEVNHGLKAAFRSGIAYAYDKGYRYAVQIDSDGQHDPVYVNRMLKKAEAGYDVVIGSRLIGKNEFAMGAARRTGSSLLRGAIFIRTHQMITDPTSGMRLYDRKAQEFFLGHKDMGPEPDTLSFMMQNGIRVAEVPVRMHDRTAGKSYLTPAKAAGYMTNELFNILLYKK